MWVFEAIKFLLAKKHEIKVLTPEKGWLAQECRKNSINASLYTYDFETGATSPKEYYSIWTSALRESDVAICTVHPPRGSFHCTVFASKCIRKANIKNVHLITKTGTIVPDYRREYYLPYESDNFHVITIAKFTRDYLIKSYLIPDQKIKLIYQGIDIARFTLNPERSVKAKKNFPLKESSPIIACIGSLEERKGHKVLFQALLKLKKTNYPKIHLLVVGDGPKEDMLKAQVKTMSLEDNVTFVPFMKETELIYARSDIIVLPSLYKEGLPNVLLEAMAMGKPVIASNVGGVAEVLKDGVNGYLVEAGKVKQLVKAILKIAEDGKKSRKMGKKGREIVVKEHNRQMQLKKFLDYFKGVKPE
ncbi:MAG: glycosyltransferase family 4 protein [Candidatus Hodarchaeales archaeon]